ncbi:MAG: amino acid adenylation domain-containing protein, partial [Nocardia sp.]|nr:amino acid adenylation domain-containing protein [Nocardia sp.]
LNPPRSTAHHPLFQVSLSFQNMARTAVELPGLTVAGIDQDLHVSQFDLQLMIADAYDEDGNPAGIGGFLTYATDLFDAATVETMVSRLMLLLHAVATDPATPVGDLDILTAAEGAALVRAAAGTVRPIPARTLPDLLDEAVEAQPDAVAVVADMADPALPESAVSLDVLTYGEFGDRVNRLARHLISLGVGPESRVALALRRGTDLVVAVHAVIAAGGAYVPVDPDQPAERVSYILDIADPVCVLTDSGVRNLPVTGASAESAAPVRDWRGRSQSLAPVPDTGRPAAREDLVRLDELDLSEVSAAPVTDLDRLTPLLPRHPAYVIFTSGSTGRPKGVSVSHAAIVNRLLWMQHEYALRAEDAVLQKTPATFDVSVWELFWPLQTGARLVVARPDGHRDPEYLAHVIADQGVSVVHFVPSMLSVFVSALGPENSGLRCAPASREEGAQRDHGGLSEASPFTRMRLRQVFASGEALPGATAQRLRELTGAHLDNLYGPTEAAVDVTYHAVTDADTVSVPIGRPVWNTRVYVLDTRLRPAVPGAVGELYLAGDQLARGYVGRADLTSDRFVANPFEPGARMYRTGDLVKWNAAGEVEYVGRSDFQVKLRGQRIELGEIEAALLAQAGVAQSVVVLHHGSTGDQLVGYVAPEPGIEVSGEAVKSAVEQSLPAYMVPSAVMVLEEFPLNASGKLDRRALPEPVFETERFRAPATPAEDTVASVFAEVLGADRVGADDDFFALGGNSLLATQVAARLGAAMDTRVPVRALFETSTVAGLASMLAQRAGTGDRVALTAGPRPAEIPLSLAQQRMWFLNRFDTDSGAYNVSAAVRLTGELDISALRLALADLVGRHEVLRTVYPQTESGPVQVIRPVEVAVPELEVSTVAADRVEAAVVELVSTGFDVAERVPMRVALFQVSATETADAADEYVLAMAVHHIAGDGASMAPLTRDLMTAYAARSEGNAPAWSPLPVQYADYAIWQRNSLGSLDDPESLAAGQLNYWKRALAGLPDQLDLPTDRPRPAQPSFTGDRVELHIDADLHRALADMARERGTTLFMVVHTAFAVLLARLSGTGDIAIGSPIAGRGEAALDDLIGMFVNTLVLRTEVDPAVGFTELLSRQREIDLEAFANADVPFEQLVEVLNPVRSTARHPLFQVSLAFQNLGGAELELPGLRVAGVDFDTASAQMDLNLTVSDSYSDGAAAGISGMFTYAVDLFDRGTVTDFAERFVRLLRALVAAPDTPVGDLALLDAAEYERLTHVHGDEVMATGLLPDLLTGGLELGRDRIAVRYNGISVTYGELDERSSRLARVLIEAGVGPEQPVALAFPRSFEMVLAVLAVAKAGGAHIPVDPGYPADRVRYMLSDSRAVLGITGSEFAADLPGDVRWLMLDDPATDEACAAKSAAPITDADRLTPLHMWHPAYVIYTSGSTGKPKGVTVTHTGLGGLADVARDWYGLEADHRFLHICSPSFDPSVLEWVCAFYTGATLVIVPPEIVGGPDLAELLRTEQVTHTIITPAVLGTVDPAGQEQLRVVSVGGDVTTAELLARWQPGRDYFNAYGPTETTIISTYANLRAGEPVTIGSPVHGMSALVLDSRLHPVPRGVAGELYLAGGAIARGYRGRPDLTAERFVANPWGEPGTRMYRTGDLVRWRSVNGVGVLDYLGRSDFQVKLRGQRIELGDIESALMAHPAVSQAVALVVSSALGEQLVAYTVPAPDAVVDTSELLRSAAERLPSYMVPAAVVVLDEFPLTRNGKLDRKALPEPVFERREFRPPSTPIEEIVAGVYADVLGVARVGADDDFFELGGNSLIATQVVARLGAAVGGRVPVRTLFEASTVAALAVAVESRARGGDRVEIGSIARPERIPLSLAQQRMWFLNRFDTDSAAYNVPSAVRLSGELDVAALRAAVGDLVARHEVLRTIYPDTDNGPVQVILPVGQSVPELEVRTLPREQVQDRVFELLSTTFDVTVEVPLRIGLFEISDAEDDYVLAMVIHHIAGDGASIAPMTRDLMTAYVARTAGAAPGWAPLPVQYADFAVWQREVLGSEQDPDSPAAKQIAYWQRELAGLPEQLDLPADRPRPAEQSFAGDQIGLEIDAELHRALVEMARAQGATLFMVVHTALAVLLARLSGTDDIAIGTPMAGRGEAALDDLIGMFVNTLVFRTRVDGSASFTELLAKQREADIAAFANADVPFERLVEVLNPVRSTARHPLFQVGLAFQNLGRSTLELPGLSVSGVDFDTTYEQYDLNLAVIDSYAENGDPAGISGMFTYAVDLFDRRTVALLAQRFLRLLGEIMVRPDTPVGDLELLDPAERERIVRGWNDTRDPMPSELLLDGYRRIAAEHPDRVAVAYEGGQLTYAEFDRRVNSLARHLISLGVGADALVGLAIRRSVDQLVGVYAILAAGGAYVPLDPDHPAERTGYVLDIAEPVCVLTVARDNVSIPGDRTVVEIDSVDLSGYSSDPVDAAELLRPVLPGHLAYVIFTSGSTGRPKGVAVSHAAVVNQVRWMAYGYGLGSDLVVLVKTPVTFDASVEELFLAPSVGGRVVIASPDGHRDPRYLAGMIAEHQVSLVDFVPSMLSQFLDLAQEFDLGSLRLLPVGGEALPAPLARRVRDRFGVRIVNGYGPTETTVQVLTHEVTDDDVLTVPIGRPLANTTAYVLDSRLNPVPAGVAGELYVGGVQEARGYISRPDLTADRFVANPFEPGARMYRTGDLVRWRETDRGAVVEYLGRTDFQVKLRGQRIELEEIEAALLAQPAVSRATVLVASSELGEQLVGYVVPAPGATIEQPELLRAAAELLPSYMVPAAIVVLDELPLNASGKLDRKALPAPVFQRREFRAPATAIEEIVAGVYAEVLGVERVGADDDFFALGGNSLIATQVAARVGAALGTRMPVRALFDAPTVSALAATAEQDSGGGRGTELGAITRPERIPLSPAQQRMWFLNRFDRESTAYNMPVAVRLSGELDVAALRAAVGDLVARHEVLRTIYPETENGPVQVILPAGQSVPELEVRATTPDTVQAAVMDLLATTFDVTSEVPLRAGLFELGGGEYVLAMVVHHIASDGASDGPMTRDLMTAYMARTAGEAPGWAPLPVQYADYAVWQRAVLGSEDEPDSPAAKQIAYWQAELAGLPEQLDLPSDRPRPAVQSFAGATAEVGVDAETHRALAELARARNTTLFMVVHTAYAVLLSRLSGTDDIAIGSPVAGRGEAELDDLIGMFVNTLVFRTRVEPSVPFTDLLARQRETDIAAYANADVPFERLVEVLNPVRSTARHPLFQVGLSFQNLAQASLDLPGLRLSGVDFDISISQFDLNLAIADGYDEHGNPAGIGGVFTYATDLFDEATVRGFVDRFVRLLQAIVADPSVPVGDIELLDSGERDRLLVEVNRTDRPVGSELLLDGFGRAVLAYPDRVAVSYEGAELTYREFDAKVNRLARLLISEGVGPESLVGLAVRRSLDLVVGMYAVVTAGGAYVPLDPDHPAERISHILETAQPVCVLTRTADEVAVPDGVGVLRLDELDTSGLADSPLRPEELSRPLRAGNPAYVIFTSGSTGRPKGVSVSHGAIHNQIS